MKPLFLFQREMTPLRKLLLMKVVAGGVPPNEYTATGNPLTFNTNVSKPLKSLLIPWTPTQTGTGDPSPSNVRPITGVSGVTIYHSGADTSNPTTYSVTFPTLGKNLFDLWANGYWNSTTKVWASSNPGAVCKPIPVKTGDVVTISQDNASATYQFIEWDKSVEQPSDYTADDCLAFVKSTDGAPKTYTIQHDCYLCVFVNIGNDTFASRHVQLEKGNQATSYEAYTNTVYGGSLDLTTGELTVEWGEIANYNGETLPGEWLSDRDVYSAGTTPTTEAQVAYELDTPVTYKLTSQQITALMGDNTIWSDTNGSNTAV